jgi:hypothetical protein
MTFFVYNKETGSLISVVTTLKELESYSSDLVEVVIY